MIINYKRKKKSKTNFWLRLIKSVCIKKIFMAYT